MGDLTDIKHLKYGFWTWINKTFILTHYITDLLKILTTYQLIKSYCNINFTATISPTLKGPAKVDIQIRMPTNDQINVAVEFPQAFGLFRQYL